MLALVAGGLAGCQLRTSPHRFAHPLLGGARLAQLEPGVALPDAAPTEVGPDARPVTAIDSDGGSASQVVTTVDVRTGDLTVTSTPAPGAPADAPPGTVVISRLPGPHRATTSPAFGSLTQVSGVPSLLAIVGTRDEAPPLAWALAASTSLGGKFDEFDRTSGAAMLASAERASRVTRVSADLAAHVAPGDLLVFDRAVAGAPASLVAVATSVDARGVITMMYLGGGIVRRGLLCPATPSKRRDAGGAALNTYLRHNKDWPPEGTKFLAGELVAASIRAR